MNFKQNDWAGLLPMAEFAYNNAKNSSSGHTPFELNCGYHLCVSFEEDINPCSPSKSANKLLAELRDPITVCQKNLHHAQELQNRAQDKGVKPRSYVPSDKVWLNNKYIKTKCNRKLQAKFFGPFRVLHLVKKTSLQTRTYEAVKDAHCLSRVTAGAGHHQKGAGRQTGEGTKTRGRR